MEDSHIHPQSISSKLSKSLQYLAKESQTQHPKHAHHHGCAHHSTLDWIPQMDTWAQLESMRRFLCQRSPDPPLPLDILDDIDAVIQYHNSHNVLTSSTSISPSVVLHPDQVQNEPSQRTSISLSVWKGDITTLTDVTAIVNAANAQLLGCFRPEHRCIDNIIHSAAGPRLRDACNTLMLEQGRPEPVGLVKLTPGFNLPASYVLHTVGPHLSPRQRCEKRHERQLADCYRACLDAAEGLPPLPDGRKVVVFCCVATGLFAFPSDVAARVALEAVVGWCLEHPDTTVTDVVFDTFLERDWVLYTGNLRILNESIGAARNGTALPPNPAPPTTLPPAIQKTRSWISQADYLIITAGAGLSASIGLDYTSTDLFSRHFPAFERLGLHRLYDVFGFNGWESDCQKWGYYFLHLDMVRTWPVSPVYRTLLDLAKRFEGRYFVRTSNADGLFVRNGFPAERVSTPQGQYRFLQCFSKCRPDAVFPSDPFVDAALPFIDSESQVLTDESKVPRCEYCKGELTICVRGGDYFNSVPFRGQERKWREFLVEVSQAVDARGTDGLKAVVLELGVGLNTPGVLRWPNEELVEESGGGIRLVRAGIGASGCAPWELEEEDMAVGIVGGLDGVVGALSA